MARITVDAEYPLYPVEKKIFGHFTEHAFGNIYGGMYDPESPMADEDGFRTDVLDLMKQVNVPLLRYPGGNFVSNYHWEDGIGPKESRKRVFEYAWLTEESNQFGTADFIKLCRKLGAEPLICVNMGSGTPEEAMHWVEYCNGTGNTYYANLRRSHGYEEPFNVKYWGVGNEMYGNWQMQNLTAEDYGKYAFQFCKAIKWVDPTVKLVACGMQEDSDWNYTIMKHIGQMVDYISAHHYAIDWGAFGPKNDYLATMGVADYMQKLHTLTLSAVNTAANETPGIKVAWDEWNLFGWVIKGVDDDSTYTLQDSVVTALILNMLLRNSDTIGMANYSTFVNINGAISVHGDKVVKRAQYPVFDLMSNEIGTQVLDVKMKSPMMTIPMPAASPLGRKPLGLDLVNKDAIPSNEREVPLLDCMATMGDNGEIYVSIVNKSPDTPVDTDLDIRGISLEGKTVTLKQIYCENIDSANTLEAPDTVAIREAAAPEVREDHMLFTVPEHSVNMLIIR